MTPHFQRRYDKRRTRTIPDEWRGNDAVRHEAIFAAVMFGMVEAEGPLIRGDRGKRPFVQTVGSNQSDPSRSLLSQSA
jgi:hypothetical protein